MNELDYDEPIRLGLGLVNAYLIQSPQGDLLVDTGLPGMTWYLLRLLRRYGSSPDRLRAIILTHAHVDHLGGLAFLKNSSDAAVQIHSLEARIVREGVILLPRGLTLPARALMAAGRLVTSRLSLSGVEPFGFLDNDMSLTQFGIEARVLHTPGHTAGSISILLSNGHALVGDLCQYGFGFGMGIGKVIPPLADHPEMLASSWERVLATGATMIHPGHGRSFPADEMRAKLTELKRRFPGSK